LFNDFELSVDQLVKFGVVHLIVLLLFLSVVRL
jgi:hypothetical protein